MANIALEEANAWLEPTKLTLPDLDPALEQQVAAQILSRLDTIFDISTWVDENTTPTLVRTIIAMEYVAWTYDKTYSDDAEANAYAALLRQHAEMNLEGILSGAVQLEEVDPNPALSLGTASFFPNDASSANPPTSDFPSDGGPSFLMGSVF